MSKEKDQALAATLNQIEKDFGMAGFEFLNAPYLKLEMLIPELECIIAQLQKENQHKEVSPEKKTWKPSEGK